MELKIILESILFLIYLIFFINDKILILFLKNVVMPLIFYFWLTQLLKKHRRYKNAIDYQLL